MSKLFLCGVANVFGHSIQTGDLLFESKTLLDSSIEVSVENTPIRGGQGAKLLHVYFHSSNMTMKLTETQFSLNFLASTLGQDVATGGSLWDTEEITLSTGGAGTVTGTPTVQPDIGGTTKYGWWTKKGSTDTVKVTFSTKTFTPSGGAEGDVGYIRYYAANAAAKVVTIPSNIIPKVVRLILDAQLFSGDGTATGSTLVGRVQIELGKAQLDGSASLNLTQDGVSNTPLSAMALDSDGEYATVTQVLDSANWYDDVIMLAVADDTIALNTGNSPLTLQVYAIPRTGSAFIAPVADLSFTSGNTSYFTAGLHTGVLTRVGAGSTTCSVAITNKSTVTLSIDVTVT